MFSNLLMCGVMLLAAFLANRKIKHRRAFIYAILVFNSVMLVMTIITENPFTGAKVTPQPARYNAPITPLTNPKDTIEQEGSIKQMEMPIPEGIEEKPIINILC
jgi:hypothetical protein